MIKQLPLQISHTALPEGEDAARCSVHCPLTDTSRPLEHCLSCPNYMASSRPPETPSITCALQPPLPPPPAFPSSRFQEELKATPVTAAMTAGALCLDSELGLPEVARLLQRQKLHWAPVVEDEGIFIGTMNETALLRGRPDDEPSYPPTALGVVVEDVMAPPGTYVRETASLWDALEQMVKAQTHHLAVVTAEDEVVGVLASSDVLRWLVTAHP